MTDNVTRRDMIEIERLADKPFTDLFPDGKATALGALAMAYVQEKKAGSTDLEFDDWLDEDVTVEESEDEPNPT